MKTPVRPSVILGFATVRRVQFFLLLLFTLSPATTQASGFRITNQSLGAVGMSGAHVAYTPGPDASYYNPANMSFLTDHWQLETSLTVLHLPEIEYTDDRGSSFNGHSEEEFFYLPLVHVATEHSGKFRYGFSLIYPFGLSKQWQQVYPKSYAEEFSLLTVEANPTMAFSITDWLSIGGGLRIVYGKGEVKNEIGGFLPPLSLRSSLKGTDTSLGYNLALSARPTSKWTVATTYRSEVRLDLNGDADFSTSGGVFPPYTGRGEVSINLPAVLSLATSYSWDRLTVELGWDRTFWSSFEKLDFLYSPELTGTPYALLDVILQKKWDDSDAYRLGLSYAWNEQWTSTLGLAYERTPVPASTLGFELPDSDAMVYCAGIRYRYSTDLEYGLSYMYYQTKTRTIDAATDLNLSGIDGRFNDGGAHALTIGVIATF